MVIGKSVMLFSDLLAKLREKENAWQIRIDSREVKKGDIFVAISGVSEDGAKYISSALQAGAAIIVCAKSEAATIAQNQGACVIYHEEPRKALWQMAVAHYQTDTLCTKHGVRVIGITGTNGKTTCAYLLEHLFSKLGHKVGVMGTVSYRWPGYEQAAPLTTPDSLTVHANLSAMIKAGVDVVIMEISSHALEQERAGGIDFSAAIFTNLTQDHLDFHPSMQNYFEAKSKLFTKLPQNQKAIAINYDDEWGAKLYDFCPHALTYGLQSVKIESEKYVRGNIVSMSPAGVHLQMNWGEKSWQMRSPLVGAFNVLNLLAVQSIALGLGVSINDLAVLEDFYGVCGRLERVQNKKNLNIFVDYAHTPDALVNVLKALREAGFTKIITVFGCGGNRDKTKRPLMGQAVAENTDIAVLTSDNPRFENPQDIIKDVLPGLKVREGLEIIVEVERKAATKQALQLLLTLDVQNSAVLIAGKGHEDYQIIEGVKHPYSDQKTVQELINEG